MVDWNSPDLLTLQQGASTLPPLISPSVSYQLLCDTGEYLKLQHVIAGIYFWEFVISLDFDWSFISGRHGRKFRWPIIFYFLDRYCLLLAMIGLLVTLDTNRELNCMAFVRFNQFAGNCAVGFASINLAIRTMAIWSQNRYVISGLTLLILGHWSIILTGVLIGSRWAPGVGCSLVSVNSKILSAMFIYSMCFDFIVLCLSAFKLCHRREGSQIVQLLFKDGLIYFVVAFVSNMVATTFMLLDLNPVMTSVANAPAAVASTIVATRVVRHLFLYRDDMSEAS
ncbi:hypothetical protein BXZ70DRAFT_896101 [Cristinia sonorae]|uniref:Transmembrane protein n=1 Tax=Cristinia sonorae TaxID=1940300 RepID=A0A8K0XNV6_9AGAR|nr:hypothetical protein BXZ70DRAFT_896101 [Cristinia sonorae]